MEKIFSKTKTVFSKHQPLWILLAMILLGAGLRLVNLGSEAFWNDEILSLDIVRHYASQPAEMIKYVRAVEIHPVGYYLMLDWWTNYFGYQEFGVRLLSVLFGLGVVVLTYILSQQLFRRQSLSLLAAFFVAILPMQIEFSQEARPYIIYTFFALLATLSFWQLHQTKHPLYIVGYIVASLAGLYLHYSYAFFALALGGFWLFEVWLKKNKNRLQDSLLWLSVHGVIFILFFWQLVAILYRIILGNFEIFGLVRSGYDLRDLSFFEITTNQIIWLSKVSEIARVEIFVIALFKLLVLGALAWLVVAKAEQFKTNLQQYAKALWLVAALIVVPMILFFFSPQSVGYTPIFERHLVFVSVFMAILLAYLLSQLVFKAKLVLTVVFCLSLMNFIVIVVSNDSLWDYHHRWGMMADQINQIYRAGDLVLVQPGSMRSNFNHYLRPDIETLAIYPLALLNPDRDFLASRQTVGLVEHESQLINQQYDELQFNAKMNYIINRHQPLRIWMVGSEGERTQKWFNDNAWTLGLPAIEPLFPLRLYFKTSL